MLTAAAACNKRDPNPHEKDPVYQQLNKDIAVAKGAAAYVADYINTNKIDLLSAVPQSGEGPVFTKRVNEGINKLTYASQQVRMYEVRIAERKLYVERRYLESLTPNGRRWPDGEEIEADLLKLRLLREKVARVTDTLPKPEVKDVPRGTQKTSVPGSATKNN